ncbi:hypothetical protein [uncultured Clostridium sp.]|uniref:hypothetical protein n=1 Tax=uncultured Clostridium sp. TaxID=59620 RepID=UPI00258B4FAC|nr:hypothetical protein [uncultured Clostridium sp.]
MSLYSVIFIILFFTVILPITLYIKIRKWGLDISRTLLVMSTCLYSVPKVHINLYNKYKSNNKKLAIELLFLPIINPKLVLALYSKATILTEAKYRAIESIIPTLNKKELKKFRVILDKEGLGVNIKRKKLKKIEVIDSKNNREKIENKQLWEKVFKQEIGETIQDEFKLEIC